MVTSEEHHFSLHFFVGKRQVLLLFSVMGRKRQVSEPSEQNVKPDRPLGSSKGPRIRSIILLSCFPSIYWIFLPDPIRSMPQALSHLILTNFEAETIRSPFYKRGD